MTVQKNLLMIFFLFILVKLQKILNKSKGLDFFYYQGFYTTEYLGLRCGIQACAACGNF